MGWIRLHKAPKRARKAYEEEFTVRQKYYFDKSYARYLKTEDGKYLQEAALGTTEIGSINNVRFIESS